MAWNEVADNHVWVMDDFLSKNELDLILNNWINPDTEIQQSGMKYLVNPTDYHYNGVMVKIANQQEVQTFVITKLNDLYTKVFGKKAPCTDLNYMQFFLKESTPNKSFYSLHSEPSVNEKEHFGEGVFMLYLSDEDDGEIVFPSEKDATPLFTKEYLKTLEEMTVTYSEKTVKIKPKKNRCVVLRTGIPHYVNMCSGTRKCISGMSYASDDYKNRWKEK